MRVKRFVAAMASAVLMCAVVVALAPSSAQAAAGGKAVAAAPPENTVIWSKCVQPKHDITLCVGRNKINRLAGIATNAGIRVNGFHMKMTLSYKGSSLGTYTTNNFDLHTYGGVYWNYGLGLILEPNAGYYGCNYLYQGSTLRGSVCSYIS